jgi:ArsR family transcriptional regulator, arsenate/arsenite/antimonite-responsive transcriptional repressor
MTPLASLFQSVADETRLRILALLMDEELCVCDLIEVLQLPQSTVSRHLAHLKTSGWVKDRRKGVWMYYSIPRNVGPVHQFLLPVLRAFLPDSEVAQKDQERLRAMASRNSCA